MIADLHIDAWQRAGLDPFDDADLGELDLMIVAGDLAENANERWPSAIQAIADGLRPLQLVILPGNHDYYGGYLDDDHALSDLTQGRGARFAQMHELHLGAYRFLLCTLWTDLTVSRFPHDQARLHAESSMHDYRQIRLSADDPRKIRSTDTMVVHGTHLRWLKERLAVPFEGKTIVVTHHGPHLNALPPRSTMSQCYVSDLSEVIEAHTPHLWLYGHTHFPTKFRSGGCELRNVSLGYPGEGACPLPLTTNFPGLLHWS